MVIQPTPYPDVNETLDLLLTKANAILGSKMVGMYLYGSLSSGDFNPASSDIDFVVATETDLEPAMIAALEKMHAEIWASELKWAVKLEGGYLPRSLIRRHDPQALACPAVNEGQFYLDRPGSDWIIQRYILREYSLALYGPDPKTLIDPVSADDLRQSVRGVLQEWWFPMLENPTWLAQHGSEYHAYAVLTMCRALHALEHGTIVSKPVAARWMQVTYPAWRSLVEQALAARAGSRPGFCAAALELIRFVKSNPLTGINQEMS